MTFWSLLIIKQYLAECVFVLAINKYDNKTASRWQQIPVLINNLLTHSYQTIRLKRPIQSKRIKRTAESLTHLIRSKPIHPRNKHSVAMHCCVKQACADIQKNTLLEHEMME